MRFAPCITLAPIRSFFVGMQTPAPSPLPSWEDRGASLATPEIGSLAPLLGKQPASPALKDVGGEFPGELVQPILAPDGHLARVFNLKRDGADLGHEGIRVGRTNRDQPFPQHWRRNQVNVSVVRRVQLQFCWL